MGILTRQQDAVFVITSDRTPERTPSMRAPARLSDNYQVWTGAEWSADKAAAISFVSLAEADEYVRANYAKVAS